MLPRLPRMYGVGPVLQAQLIRGLRTSGRWLIFGGVMGAATFGPPMLTQDQDFTRGATLPFMVIGATAYLTFLAGAMLPMGFRGDVDHLDWLKSLPLTPLTVAAGEVLGPALFFSLMNCAVFLPASWAVTPAYPLLLAAVCSLPVNAVFFGIENLVFTMYPSRQMPTTPGDFHFMGTAFIMILLKGLLLMIAAVPTAIVGVSCWLLSGPWLAVPAMRITTAGTAAAVMFLVARCFDPFDPSTDSPP